MCPSFRTQVGMTGSKREYHVTDEFHTQVRKFGLLLKTLLNYKC
jgi:hypothetical protein